VNRDGEKSRVTFVIIDAGRVVDVQKQTIPTSSGNIQIGSKMIDLASCASL